MVFAMADPRLTVLEEKVAFQDDTITQLDEVICSQQEQIDVLKKQLEKLESMVSEVMHGDQPQAAADEKPPHY